MAARIPVALLLAGLLAGCSFPGASSAPAIAYAARNARWVPSANATYQIQYDGKLDLSVSAEVYDVDAFDTTAHQVAAIHARARRAVCYVDVGTWEKWRPDASQFPKSVLGLPDGGWPGERWLDIRQTSVLEPIVNKRLQLCKSKNFDGVDPDNLDGYETAILKHLGLNAWIVTCPR